MDKEVFKILEFDKILLRLRNYATSNIGKELVLKLEPSGNFEIVRESLQWTGEAAKVLTIGEPPLGGFRDVREILKKIKLESSATSKEFLDLLSTMYALRQMKKFLKEMELEIPKLKNRAAEIEILGLLERQIEYTIDEHGNVRDNASVKLQKIRLDIRNVQNRLKDEIFNILHDNSKQKFFQDAIVTMRNDRYVFPVKIEYKSQITGIIHDQSATGSTVFIEPIAVVNLNNTIKQLEIDEQQEVARILRALSEAVRKNLKEFERNVKILGDMDLIFAKAKFARDLNATEPILEEYTELRSAKHPLIDSNEVVPIDIELGKNFSILLVTGSNTGGKTVSMKTLGLLALMTQAGLYIPVANDSKMSVYTNIFADIGDEQSIEQSLSTFSSHMKKIVNILSKTASSDLVLLDEIGAGTDPIEGAALATSILEELLKLRAAVVATTHYSELKTFAYSTNGIENACVEFNSETLLPTYKILIGTPGASNALAISRRLGLPKELVMRAQKLIDNNHVSFETVIGQLENERILYNQRNSEVIKLQQKLFQDEKRIAELKNEIAKAKGEIIRKAKEKSSAMIREAKREAEEIIEALKEQFDDAGVKRRQQVIQQSRDKIRSLEINSAVGIISDKYVGTRINKKKLLIGDTIYIKPLDQKGVVLAIEKNGEELNVQIGMLRTVVKTSACRFVSRSSQKLSTPTVSEKQTRGSLNLLKKVEKIHREIDIRGMLVNEAEQACEKFIDDAQLAGLKQILIIHGKGTGALRQGIHDYLRINNSVADFQFADTNEGGSGATIVTIR